VLTVNKFLMHYFFAGAMPLKLQKIYISESAVASCTLVFALYKGQKLVYKLNTSLNTTGGMACVHHLSRG